MARILVADDNSNIQKMVGLALKDQGIDVVAVGNGEAAVRKISDIRPDLVLADVFMPVRNGYEVCQYVKSDSTLAHIPVILLVGAFDPLDEQEAQRVGADGVLKKPFVPPDPLISMVKSALARAGVSIGGAAPAPPVHEEPVRVAEMLTPRSAPSLHALPSKASLTPMQEIPSVESMEVQEDMPALPEPVKIDAGSQPLAFGNLLESPVAEPEEDLGYATTARPELERDWKSGDKEDEVEEEEEEDPHSASWRRDGGDEAMDEEPAAGSPVKDWRETAFSEAPARKMRDDSWAPQKEISGFAEAAETQQSVGAMVTDAPVAETRMSSPPPAPQFTEDAWAAALRPKTAVEAATMEAPAPVAQERAVAAEVAARVPVEIPASAPAKVESVPEAAPEQPAASSWFSSVASPWDVEAQKASRLASTWDVPVASAVPETAIHAVERASAKDDPAATVDALAPIASEETEARVEEAALPAATVEAIREEAQHVTETATQESPVVDLSKNVKATEPSMEDLVAKVLAKMNPEMLQAVTRDILKNVVESMVRDELNAKKQ